MFGNWKEGDKVPMIALFVGLLGYWKNSINRWLNVDGLDSPYRTWVEDRGYKRPSLMSWGCAIEQDYEGAGWALYDRGDHLAQNGIKMDCYKSAEEALTQLLLALDISPHHTMVAHAYHAHICTPMVEFMAPNGVILSFPGRLTLNKKTCVDCGHEYFPRESRDTHCMACVEKIELQAMKALDEELEDKGEEIEGSVEKETSFIIKTWWGRNGFRKFQNKDLGVVIGEAMMFWEDKLEDPNLVELWREDYFTYRDKDGKWEGNDDDGEKLNTWEGEDCIGQMWDAYEHHFDNEPPEED